MEAEKSIITSKSDTREHKFVQLSNSIDCIIISDPDTDKSAAALDVRIGSSYDPKDAFGLAHFLEHMLFMGTEKYPGENEYMEFLSPNAGDTNAYTTSSDTNYHFNCSNEAFYEGLDRFAQFFIKPIFAEQSTLNEINAVDSEFKKNLQDDSWRIGEIMRAHCNPESKYANFEIGNAETLNVPHVRPSLIKFFKDYYSARLMKLVVYGSETIEKLEEWVKEIFLGIEDREPVTQEFSKPAPYEVGVNLGRVYKVVPVMDKNEITLSWWIPSTEKLHKTRPLEYLKHLLGHSGPNSLLSYLISEGLAIEVATEEDHQFEAYTNLSLTIRLTTKGLQNYREVVRAVFAYLQLIKEAGPQEYIFNEMQKAGDIAFEFLEKEDEITYVEELAIRMHLFNKDNIQDIITTLHQYQEFDPSLIKEITSQITHENLNIYLSSREFAAEANLTEKWYGSTYRVEDVDQELSEAMRNPSIDFSKSRKKIGLPPKNDLIPKNVDILPKDEEAQEVPVLETGNSYDLWFKKDDNFEMPKATVDVRLYEESFGKSVEHRVFQRLWDRIIVNEYLREYNYMGHLANIEFSSSVLDDSIEYSFQGFSDTLPVFITETFKKIKELDFDNEQLLKDLKSVYELNYSKLLDDVSNHFYKPPHTQATRLDDNLFVDINYKRRDYFEAIKAFTFERFVEIGKTWLKSGRIELLVNGNLDHTAAKSLTTQVLSALNFKELPREEIASVKTSDLPPNSVYYYSENFTDKSNLNSGLISHFELGVVEDKERLVLETLLQYLKDPAFDTLRTKEQLGYVVYLELTHNRGAYGIRLGIQSNVGSPEFLVQRVNSFLEAKRKEIKDVTEEEFNKNVESVIVEKTQKDYSLSMESQRFWKEILQHTYNFNRQTEDEEILRSLVKEDIIQMYEDLVFSKVKRIDVEIVSSAHEEEQKVKEEENKKAFESSGIKREKITSIPEFKSSVPRNQDKPKENFIKISN